MTLLPRVAEYTREKVSREFDSLGPDICLAEITQELRDNNPELLDMATKCATDIGASAQIMVGFCMFYRLLIAQSSAADEQWPEARKQTQAIPGLQLSPLPRVTQDTRELIVRDIDKKGSEGFTRDTLEELERSNPELLQMADGFASGHSDYLGVMQGFALLYGSLIAQSARDRTYMQ